jgi:hypothetical protein
LFAFLPTWTYNFDEKLQGKLLSKEESLLIKAYHEEETGEPVVATLEPPGYGLFSVEERLLHFSKAHGVKITDDLQATVEKAHKEAVLVMRMIQYFSCRQNSFQAGDWLLLKL